MIQYKHKIKCERKIKNENKKNKRTNRKNLSKKLNIFLIRRNQGKNDEKSHFSGFFWQKQIKNKK